MKKTPSILLYSFAPEEIRPLFRDFGIEELPLDRQAKPDWVVTYGGDGTFITAEREWPGVPKVILRRSRVCETCLQEAPRRILKNLASQDLQISQYPKVSFQLGLTEAVASTDIILRNLNPNQALRFHLKKVSGAQITSDEIIGDGLVLSTGIGARAYYRSITGRVLDAPYGLAFNNPTRSLKPIDLAEKFSMTVEITRETGVLCLDNLPCFWNLRPGEKMILKNHPDFTRVANVLDHYCKTCQEELGF